MKKSGRPLKENPEQTEFAENLVKSLNEPVVVLDRDGIILAANHPFIKILDSPPKKIGGKDLVQMFGSPKKATDLEVLLQILLNSETAVKDFPVVLPGARANREHFRVNANCLSVPNAAPLFLLSFQDVGFSHENHIDYKRLLNEILSKAPAMICTLRGPDHVFELTNDKYLELLEYREIIGKSVKEVLPEVENQGFIKMLDEVYASGTAFIGKEISLDLKGRKEEKNVILDFLYQPIKDASGNVEGIFVHAIDVTEKVLNRRRLENREQELKNLIDTVPVIIWISNSKAESYYLNRKWYDYTGQRRKKSLGAGWLNCVHPEDREMVSSSFQVAHEEQKEYNVKYRLRTRNEAYRWVMDRGRPRWTADNKFEGLIGTVTDIHEDQLQQETIRENEHRIRTIVEQATVATAIYVGKDMKIQFANKAMTNLWGRDESIVGKTLRTALPELEGQPFHDLLQEVYTTGETYWGKEDRVDLRRNGTIETGYFNFTYKPLRNAEGEIYGILNMALDVTEQVITRKKIQESEKRYQDIILSSPYPISTWKGKDHVIELANDAMIQTWGKGKDVFGKPLLEVFPELIEQGFEEILRKVYETGKPFKGYEMPVDLVRNGVREKVYYNFVYYPQRDLTGKIVGIVDIATEVTPQAELKKKLEQSESHYRQMADLMPEKVINTGPDGLPLYFNQNWLDYTGLTSEELKEKNWMSLLHPEDKQAFLQQWNSSLESGQKFETEIRIADKEQNYLWHLSRAEAVRGEDGEITMWIGTNTEIQKLKEEEKRKEDFLKVVSHELKTPVTSIKGYVQLLLNLLEKHKVELPAAVPVVPSLQRIDSQVVRLTRLISEILDLSRLKESKLELKKELFELNTLVEQTVQDIKLTSTRHEMKIFHSHRAKVFADKDRIGQVLINFITNAIKYSPGSQLVEIHILNAGNDGVEVSVRDKGIGIDEKFQKNIFKKFYRVGAESEESYSGFGIGLYLASEIIERHEGYVKLKSKKGKGSDFGFVLREHKATTK